MFSLSQKPEMFEQNLTSEDNQHDAAGKLRARLIARAEHVSDFDTSRGQHERRTPNDRHGGQDRNLQKSKRDADRQRIDARRNGEREHRPKRERIVELLRLPARFLYHIGADEGEQHKSNPMVNARDVLLEPDAERIAEQRHQKLKAAEVRTGGTGVRKF